jgi:hypothetical protein
VTKQFTGGAGNDILLDFSALPRTMNLELKLAHDPMGAGSRSGRVAVRF